MLTGKMKQSFFACLPARVQRYLNWSTITVVVSDTRDLWVVKDNRGVKFFICPRQANIRSGC